MTMHCSDQPVRPTDENRSETIGITGAGYSNNSGNGRSSFTQPSAAAVIKEITAQSGGETEANNSVIENHFNGHGENLDGSRSTRGQVSMGGHSNGVQLEDAGLRTHHSSSGNGHPEVSTSQRVAPLEPHTPIAYALRKLARAFQFAIDCNRSKWDFAVEISDMDSLGISHDELRWMIGKGIVEHAREVENQNGIGRSFDSPGGFTFSNRSCFVVTSSGLHVSNELTNEFGKDFLNLPVETGGVQAQPSPFWDDQRHELRLGTVVVKRFKWRASNQEAILAAFQEDGWPARIDDPLSPVPETDPKRRLSDTIKCLNRKQKNAVLRFSGDGTGEGVLWDIVSADHG